MTKLFNTRLLAAAVVAGVALTSAAAATAAAVSYDPDTNAAVVSAADLNLSSASDARTLIIRLHSAASAVCGDAPAKIELSRRRAYDACVADAYAGAIARLNNPTVTAMSAGKAYPVAVAAK
jgi:UrcA family protein